LQGATAKNTDYYCQAMEGKGCNECWNCAGSLEAKSEVLVNLFQTVIDGTWTTRSSWSGEKTKIQNELDISENYFVDFLAGFTGYGYTKAITKIKYSSQRI
jgi:hypothetical protein